MSATPASRARFLADVAAVYRDDTERRFGSGRLIAPNLILTAGHVVDDPEGGSPQRSGWRVALLRDRAADSSWTAPARDAGLVWRGVGELDLALLELEGDVELRPAPQPVLASYDGLSPIADTFAAGFPDGRSTLPETLDDYLAPGVLRGPSQYGPYVWNVPRADKPDDKRGWRGMSGAGVCRVETDGRLYLFGAVEEVPVNFSHQLQVAPLTQAFDDPEFRATLRAALGAEPQLVTFELQPRRRDLGIAQIVRLKTRNFEEEYLASETSPIPFGGRDLELRRLDEWLLDPGRAPRMLVTAPAGRGKSALLVQWMKNLQDGRVCGGDGWALAFMPISIRVGTNLPRVFYHGLESRLAEIMQEDAPSELARDADDFRSIAGVRLERLAHSRRSVLVVVDGLDEAPQGTFDSTIFPRLLPSNFRLLLSARWQKGDIDSRGWLRRLQWDRNVKVDHLELGKLDQDHIRDVLVKLGAPVDSVGTEPALVEKLLELTDGEPLLVRYYAEDLWQFARTGARVTRADLGTLKPGFNAYFERWFDHQETLWRQEGADIDRATVDRALCALAFALGPLEERDLLALVRRMEDTTQLVAVDRLIAPLRRFVFGEGKRGSGYVLSHPRIGQYLQDERFSAIAEDVRRVFADWGRTALAEVNANPGKAERTPTYLLQFLSEHFDQIDAAPADYVMMVEDGWRRAWETFEGGQGGFAADVRRVQAVLKDHGRERAHLRGEKIGLGGQVRCALCLSSIASISGGVQPPLLALVVKYGLFSTTQALSALRLNPSETWTAEGLIAIAPYLSRDEVAASASASLLRIEARDRPWFVSRLAGDLSREKLPLLLELTSSVEAEDEKTKALLLGFCASALAAPEARQAVEVARGFNDHAERLAAMGDLAFFATSLELRERQEILDDAFSVARLLGEEAAVRMLRFRTKAHAPELLRDGPQTPVADALEIMREDPELISTVVHAAKRLPEPDRAVIAGAALARLADQSDREQVLRSLIPALPPEGLQEALGVVQNLRDSPNKVRLLAAITARATEDRRMEAGNGSFIAQLVIALCACEPTPTRNSSLAAIRPHLEDLGSASVMALCLQAVEADPETLQSARIWAFVGSAAPPVARATPIARALDVARKASFSTAGLDRFKVMFLLYGETKEPHLAAALADIMSILPPEERTPPLEEARRAVRLLPPDYFDRHAEFLTSLAAVAPEGVRDTLVGEALASAKHIEDEIDKQQCLVDLATLVPHSLGAEAVNAALTIETVDFRVPVLAALAPHISGPDLVAGLKKTLADARRIGDERAREALLLAVRPYLPPDDPAVAAVTDIDRYALDHERKIPRSPALRRMLVKAASTIADQVLAADRAGDLETDGDDQWVGVLLAAVRIAPKKRRARIVAALLAVMRWTEIENRRRALLVDAGPHLLPDEAKQAWSLALALKKADNRVEALAALIANLPEAEHAAAIAEILELGARLRRGLLLTALRRSAAAIHSVGGEVAVRELAKSACDVGVWWP